MIIETQADAVRLSLKVWRMMVVTGNIDKAEVAREVFPGKDILYECPCCEYASQQAPPRCGGVLTGLDVGACEDHCPISYGMPFGCEEHSESPYRAFCDVRTVETAQKMVEHLEGTLIRLEREQLLPSNPPPQVTAQEAVSLLHDLLSRYGVYAPNGAQDEINAALTLTRGNRGS
jgi:hypothetical protein